MNQFTILDVCILAEYEDAESFSFLRLGHRPEVN